MLSEVLLCCMLACTVHRALLTCAASDSRPVCIPGVSRFMPNCNSFEEWFKDVGALHSNPHCLRHCMPSFLPRHLSPQVPGVNQVIRGKTLSLTGVRDHPSLGWAAGEFSFESSTFFPIDNQEANVDPDPFYNQTYTKFTQVGFGNEGKEHNYHFCTEIHTVHHITLYVVHHIVHHVVRACLFACCGSRHHHTAYHNRLLRTTVSDNLEYKETMTSGSSSTTASR